jgi:hypothetical protein
LQLGDGDRCLAAQGAHETFHGRVVDYYCKRHVAVLRGINRQHQPWLVRNVTYDAAFHYRRGPLRQVARDYVGRRSWQPGHD